MSHPKKQHFVPQFLLRNFTKAKGRHLAAFDKRAERTFWTPVVDAAEQNGFYDFEVSGGEASIEQSLSDLEDTASVVIQRVVAAESLASLSESDRATIATFCAVQMCRVPHYREVQRGVVDFLRRIILESNADPKTVNGFGDPSDEDMRRSAILDVTDVDWSVPHFLNKAWALQKAPSGSCFYVGDNPLVLSNLNDFRPYGNLGLAVRGIEIHLPLSSQLSLWLVCPTIRDRVKFGYASMFNMAQSSGIQLLQFELLRQLVEGFESGKAVPMSRDNVDYVNSLQVEFASRFLYCQSDDFGLAKRMILHNPGFKSGKSFVPLDARP